MNTTAIQPVLDALFAEAKKQGSLLSAAYRARLLAYEEHAQELLVSLVKGEITFDEAKTAAAKTLETVKSTLAEGALDAQGRIAGAVLDVVGAMVPKLLMLAVGA